MKTHLAGKIQFRKLSLIALVAAFALASVACGAAPDGDPSHEPAASTATSDKADEEDAGSAARVVPVASSWWVPAEPTRPEPPTGGGAGNHPQGNHHQ